MRKPIVILIMTLGLLRLVESGHAQQPLVLTTSIAFGYETKGYEWIRHS
jgi:hypothetical protein